MNDPDAPTILVYAPTPWLARTDMYGDRHDDDCADASDDRYTFPDDPDDVGRWCRADALDCGDGLPDAPEPDPHTHDLCPF